jgi:hypothetical protein
VFSRPRCHFANRRRTLLRSLAAAFDVSESAYRSGADGRDGRVGGARRARQRAPAYLGGCSSRCRRRQRSRGSSAASVSRWQTKQLIAGRQRRFVIVVGERADRCAGAASDPRRHVGRDAVSFEHYEELTTDERGSSPSAGGHKVAWFNDPDGNTFAVEGTADSSPTPSQVRPTQATRRGTASPVTRSRHSSPSSPCATSRDGSSGSRRKTWHRSPFRASTTSCVSRAPSSSQ